MPTPSADRINARAAKDKAFLKRALRDPGLRSKLDPKYLSGGQRQQRELNVRLNAPVTPGSSMTERDLAHQAQAATTVRYGPQEGALGQQLGVAQQTERDTGSFYDQYLANLQQHQANVAAFQAGAQQALAQTAQGITGLSGQDATQLQAMANQQAGQQGVAPAGDMTQLQNQATATRQALLGSFQAQQALQGANANTFADTQARVVGPGQKLSALAQAAGRTKDVRQKVTDLKAEEGAYNQSFRDTRRQDEFKNVLAGQTLGLNTAKAQADIAAKDPATVVSTAGAKSAATTEASTAAKYGYSVHDWRMLGPKGRQSIINKKTSSSGGGSDTTYTQGAFAGMTKSEVSALTPQERKKKVDDYNAGKGSGSSTGGPDWRTQEQMGTALTQLASLKSMANKIKSGQPLISGHGAQAPQGRHGAAQKILAFGPVASKLKDPILVSAALDAVYDGHLSAATIKKLIAAGFKPSRVAQTLGVPTAGNYKPKPKTPGQTAAGKIPGIGPTVK